MTLHPAHDVLAPPTRTYRVDAFDICREGNDAVDRGEKRPGWRECARRALVRMTWRWRGADQPLRNAARAAVWRQTQAALPLSVAALHDALADPRESAHFDRIKQGEF